jgi:hypothetical protein
MAPDSTPRQLVPGGPAAPARGPQPWQGFTARAVLIALALIPVNIVFMLRGLMWGESRPATVSLIFNVVVSLALVTLASRLLARLWPRLRLSPAELAVVYSMLTIAGSVTGLDQVQTMVPVVAHPFWAATPENRWEELFLKETPRWVTVDDPRALWAYFDSHLPLFATPYWGPWVRVAAVWGSFTLMLLWVMFCVNTLLRRNWVEEAKLSFPIIQLPLAILEPRSRLFTARLMWIGFGVALAVDVLNGLSRLYPQVPSILGSYYDLGAQLRSMPWQAIGWTPLNVFPFAVGLAFFIPLDLAFSCWFFYLYWKAVAIFGAALGWTQLPGAPWIDEQSHAAYQALAILSLYGGRRQLADAVRSALAGPRPEDAREPIPYRVALLGAIAGLAGLTAFCMAAGMSLAAALAFLLLYLGVSIAVARIRAELGSPVHDLHKAGPELILTELLGPRAIGKRNLIMFSFFWSFNRAHRSHPMPHLIEPMKLGEQAGAGQHAIAAALGLAAVIAVPLAWLVMLDSFCRYGGTGSMGKGYEAFNRLAQWLTAPGETNWRATGAVAVGGLTTALLAAARLRWAWWPFHPAGYAVSGSWSMQLFAPSVFASWLVKTIVLRYGGMASYRPASTFFLGMILGEFVAGTFWGTLGILQHRPMYNFLP